VDSSKIKTYYDRVGVLKNIDIEKDLPDVKSDSAMGEALELVESEIESHPILSTQLEEIAIEKGISLRSLRRAREALRDCGKIEITKAPGIKRWYVHRRGAKISWTTMTPDYEPEPDDQIALGDVQTDESEVDNG